MHAKKAAHDVAPNSHGMAGHSGVSGKALVGLLLGLLSPLLCSALAPFAIFASWHALNDVIDQEDQGVSRGLAYSGLILGGIGMIMLGLTLAGFPFGLLWALW